jgi:20S proteasome alpha/beta subunit
MTLVIAVPGKEFIVLGADSRAVIDSGVARVEINTVNKIIPITEYAAVLTYGSSEAANQLVEKFKSKKVKKLKWTRDVAENFCDFCRREEKKLAGVPRHPDSFDDIFGFIVAGLDKTDDKYEASAYNLCSFDGFRLGLCKPYAIKGKPLIALYIFVKKFYEDMTVNELCKLVAQSIYDTERIDGDVGGPIKLAVIDLDGLREISSQDIMNLVETWELENLKRIME